MRLEEELIDMLWLSDFVWTNLRYDQVWKYIRSCSAKLVKAMSSRAYTSN